MRNGNVVMEEYRVLSNGKRVRIVESSLDDAVALAMRISVDDSNTREDVNEHHG